MTISEKRDNLDALAEMFGNCPAAVAQVRETLGDSGELLDFWFDFALGHHAVFYKFKRDGRTETTFAVLAGGRNGN